MAADRRRAGFSLLEVMVALGILALALIVLVSITTDNVRATHHAKMVTAATFLARAKMADLEDVVLEEGFVDNDREEDGDFSDEGRPEFRWTSLIQKIELPTDLAQQTQEEAQDMTQNSSGNPLMAMAGFMGGFMSALIEPIRVGLEESVRRVTVKVSWDEPGRPEQSFEVETFMTDPAKLDAAIGAVGNAPGTTGQGQGQPGTGGTTGTGTGAGGGTGTGRQGGRVQ